MARVSVGTVVLRLVAPHALRAHASTLQARAQEGFLPAVLQALGERLQQAYGREARVRIRSLHLRLAMPASGLQAQAWVERLSEDLAAQVQQMAQREGGTDWLPAADASVQVYRDGPHERAAALVAAARGRPGPGDACADLAALWQGLRREPPPVQRATLVRCVQAQGLDEVLSRLSEAQLEALAQALAPDLPAPVAQALARACRHAGFRTGRQAGSLRPGQTAGAAATSGGLPAPSVPRSESRPQGAGRGEAAAAGGLAVAPPVAGAAADGAGVPPARPALPASRRDTGGVPAAGAPGTQAAAVLPMPSAAAPGAAAAAPAALPGTPAAQDACAPAQDEGMESGWCGLLYLLNVSQRLELPERLWQVGADEGATFAAMLERLSGVPREPCAMVLRPAGPAAAPGMLPHWAREELREAAWTAAARWLPDADLDAARLHATALQAWFTQGQGFDLVAWAAALHLALAECVLGGALAPGLLAERFGRPGRILVQPGTVRVVQPMAAIDMDMRRAGLDADPGWLGWLDKRLVFEFTGGEQEPVRDGT